MKQVLLNIPKPVYEPVHIADVNFDHFHLAICPCCNTGKPAVYYLTQKDGKYHFQNVCASSSYSIANGKWGNPGACIEGLLIIPGCVVYEFDTFKEAANYVANYETSV